MHMSFEGHVEITCCDDLIAARHKGRILAAQIGFSSIDQAMLAAVITELVRNIVDHAEHGEILLHPIKDAGRRGIAVIARDRGHGIPNIKQALQFPQSAAGVQGLGLKGVEVLTDSLDIISIPGRGTRVTARKWLW